VVLVFDGLTVERAALAREGALDLLSGSFPPDTYFAVFKIGYRATLVEPFTRDPKRLRSALLRATELYGEKRAGETAGDSPPAPGPGGESIGSRDGSPSLPDLGRQFVSSLVAQETAELSRRDGFDTLYALRDITRALGSVKGRKAVVYFSQAWHFETSLQYVYDDAVSEANRANVAVHTVDVRGLAAEDPFVATLGPLAPRAGHPGPTAHSNAGADSRTPLSRTLERIEDRVSGPSTVRLADDTGGLVIRDTNDLGAGLAAVAQELSHYYEIVYVPANPNLDGRFRRITVTASRPDVRLRTRVGYFATAKDSPMLAARDLPLMTALDAATLPDDFALRTGALYFAPSDGERQCVLVAEVPLSAVEVASDETADLFRAHLTFLAFVKDAEGRVVARLSHDWPMEGPLSERAQARTRSAVFRRTLPLAPGSYVLETAVQDAQSQALSATHMPFVVPPAGAGLSLGSVSLLRRVQTASAESALGNPLVVGNLLLFPDLEASFAAGSRPELSFFVPVYPTRPGASVELMVELRRAAEVVARSTTTLAEPGPDGRIPWIGGIPSKLLRPGVYEIVVRARQGEARAEESVGFDVPVTNDPGL
jgi:VWFA-related protein